MVRDVSGPSGMMAQRHSLLIIGAFPGRPVSHAVRGGMLQSCELLEASSLPRRVRLIKLDTTQKSVPAPGLFVRLLLAIRRCWRFVGLLRKESPGFVMAFASGGSSFIEKSLMLQLARARGAHTLMFIRHGAFMHQCERSPIRRFVARALLTGVAVHLCQSETWRRFFVATLGFAESRCRVIENWTVTPELLEIGRNRNYDASGRSVRFVYLGWLERQKGIPELLDAFARLTGKAAPAAELVLAGSGSLQAFCRQFLASRQLEDRVRLAGWVSGEEKLELLRTSDVFVLPSHAEGLSNAMLEAMAAGLPVIVSRVGSLPDVVSNEVDGLLIEPGDTDALTQCMRRLAQDTALRMRLGQAANGTASRFNVERAVDEMMTIMDDIAGGE